MHSSIKHIVPILASVALASCSQEDKNGDSSLEQSTIPSDAVGHTVLGQGFDTQKVKTLNVSCATGDIQENRYSDSDFSLDYDMSYSDFLAKIEGTLSAELNLPVVRAGVGATYAKENAATSYSNTFVFNWKMLRKSQYFDLNSYRVSKKGQDFINGDKSQLRERCGDEFITRADYGASFFVSMKVDYLNDVDKSDIGGKLKLGIGEGVDIVKLEGELKKIDNKKKESVKIVIRARQVGGDPTMLTSFLPENIIECSLANAKPCFNVFNQAINYAKTSIPTQLNNDAAFAPIKYISENYKESGLDTLVPSQGYQNLDQLTKNKRFEIETDYQKNLTDYQRASDILRKYSDYLEPAQLEEIVQIKETTFANAFIYADMSQVCYDTPSNCVAHSKEVQGGIKKYDRTRLALRSSMADLRTISLGGWTFGHTKDAASFTKKVVAGNNTLEDRQGVALKSDTGELIRVATYFSEADCTKVADIVGSSAALSIISARDYGIKFSNDDFDGEYTFSMQAAFRSQAAGKCLLVSMYPLEPHKQKLDLGSPSELRTFVRRVLESVN